MIFTKMSCISTKDLCSLSKMETIKAKWFLYKKDSMTIETTVIFPLKIFYTLIIIYQPLREWSFYFTTHMLPSSLQLVLRLCTTLRSSEELIRCSLKNRLIFSFKKDLRMISTPCWKVCCHISTENKRWYWQLYFGVFQNANPHV
jgi:hypothetical protein